MGFSTVICSEGATLRYAAPSVPGIGFVIRRVESELRKLRLKSPVMPGVSEMMPCVDTFPPSIG